MPTHSTVYILQPCLWNFHCSSFKDMGLQIPLISTGSLPTRKLGTSHYSLLFQALGSECQDFCLSGLKEVWTQHLLTFMESCRMVLQHFSLWMKSCDGETIKIDMALLAVIFTYGALFDFSCSISYTTCRAQNNSQSMDNVWTKLILTRHVNKWPEKRNTLIYTIWVHVQYVNILLTFMDLC